VLALPSDIFVKGGTIFEPPSATYFLLSSLTQKRKTNVSGEERITALIP
jgi:hypothetical protein